jgi:hypothetical protein
MSVLLITAKVGHQYLPLKGAKHFEFIATRAYAQLESQLWKRQHL